MARHEPEIKYMKILCIADRGISEEAMRKACSQYLPRAECITEKYPEMDTTILSQIEKNGPDSVPALQEFVKHRGEDIDAIIGSILIPVSKEVLDLFPQLRIVGTCRGGLENINMEACRERGILVVNAYGRNAEAVSDYTLAMMLSELRNVARSHHNLSGNKGEKTWQVDFVNSEYLPHMAEATVGIYGYGFIGKLVAQKCAGFGSRVVIYDAFVKPEQVEKDGYTYVSRDELFRNSDIVTIHLRLLEATRGIVTKNDIDSMKKTAFFINAARAGLIDYDALYDALAEKRIGGAAIDVFPEEPLPADSKWRKLDNCTITAHLAGSVMASRPYAAKIVADTFAKALKGEDTPQLITKDAAEAGEFKRWASKVLSAVE